MYYEVNGSRLRILGTNHIVPEGRPLPAFVLEAVDWAEAACTEHDPSQFQARTSLPEGQRLQDLLPVQIWQDLLAAWRSPEDELQKQKPWAAALNLGLARLRFSPGAEAALAHKLSSLNRGWGALEHGDEVADLLDSVPLTEVAAALAGALPEIDKVQEHFEATYDSWAARDTSNLLAGLSQSPLYSQPSIRAAFLTTRNRSWADRLLTLGQPPINTVLAVGCFHLIGEGNFIDELRARGLQISELT